MKRRASLIFLVILSAVLPAGADIDSIYRVAVGITLQAFYQKQRITLAIQLIVVILSFVVGAKLFN